MLLIEYRVGFFAPNLIKERSRIRPNLKTLENVAKISFSCFYRRFTLYTTPTVNFVWKIIYVTQTF